MQVLPLDLLLSRAFSILAGISAVLTKFHSALSGITSGWCTSQAAHIALGPEVCEVLVLRRRSGATSTWSGRCSGC